ncbi:MAG TPA: hypothetical protein DCS93_09620 [Microscillaceae bacterium]|nr:hypothetical protein [Microscillaceae bacterium]
MMAILLVMPACNNSNDTPTPGNTTNQNLLKTWKASQVLEGSLDVTGEFGQYRLTLAEANGNKTFTLIKRDGTSLTGSWEISADETTITLTANSNTITLSGVSVSASELKYTTDEQGKTGIVNLSFTLVPA